MPVRRGSLRPDGGGRSFRGRSRCSLGSGPVVPFGSRRELVACPVCWMGLPVRARLALTSRLHAASFRGGWAGRVSGSKRLTPYGSPAGRQVCRVTTSSVRFAGHRRLRPAERGAVVGGGFATCERRGTGYRQSRGDRDDDLRVGRKPKGASSGRRWKHRRDATDSPMEQRPEVGGGSTARGWTIRSRMVSIRRGSSLTTRGKRSR